MDKWGGHAGGKSQWGRASVPLGPSWRKAGGKSPAGGPLWEGQGALGGVVTMGTVSVDSAAWV